MGMTAGTKLGTYEVVSRLGAGGMGEVYEATDSRLKRRVALKVIAGRITKTSDGAALFEREAQTLASISHPNIATVYGLQDTPDGYAIVMELVGGEDLSQKVGTHPLSIEESLAIARQICEGLEAAHERGVIHRDLKPANIKITDDGTVKILDFGLAKTATPDHDISSSPTILTIGGEGAVIGTAPYMSPEQAKARPVDARTDVWAFGCVLYEMLTGTRAFAGETATEILASVIKSEPDWAKLPKGCPAHVERTLRRCLEKDLKKRIRHVGDVRYELDHPTSAAAAATEKPSKGWFYVACALLGVTVLALGYVAAMRSTKTAGPTRRFEISVPGFHDSVNTFYSVSRSGQNMVWVSQGKLWLRDISELNPRNLPAGDSPSVPLLSPDGQFVAFASAKKLWKISVNGGAPLLLCDIPGSGEILTGDWISEGEIYVAVWRGDVLSVPAEGGSPKTVWKLNHNDTVDIHTIHLVGKDEFFYFKHMLGQGQSYIGLYKDGKEYPTQLRGESPGYFPGGYLLYEMDQGGNASIWAVKYSLREHQPKGNPVLVASSGMFPKVMEDGTIVYISSAFPRGRLTWVNRKGELQGSLGSVQDWLNDPVLSPDGKKVLYTASDGLNPSEVWVLDTSTNARRRLTFAERASFLGDPSWSPQGDKVYFSGILRMTAELYSADANGTGSVKTLGKGYHATLAPDGKALAYEQLEDNGVATIHVMWLDGSGKNQLVAETGNRTSKLSISRDGKYIAYGADETGRTEIYVRQFPQGEGKWQVSTDGGLSPTFSPDGKELFYYSGNALYSIPISTAKAFDFGLPRKLFESDKVDLAKGFGPTRDGQKFLTVEKLERDNRRMVVIENWQPPQK